MGKANSIKSILSRVVIVFAFIVFVICYYEYKTLLSTNRYPTVVQQRNLRQEKVERRLESVATIGLTSIADLSHFNHLYYQITFWMGSITSVISIKKEEADTYSSLVKNALFPTRVRVFSFETDGDSFPINMLRNMAFKNTDTTHVLMTDIDVFPDASLYSAFLSLPTSLLEDPKQVIVLPLFETTHYTLPCTNWYTCSSQMSHFFQMKKYELRMCTVTNACTNLGSTGANQYVGQSWFFLPKDSLFTKYSCWENTRQQPFVIVRKSKDVPEFFEHLRDFGNNRLEWINHLRFRGFEFNLLSQSWLYHTKHRQSAIASQYDQKKDVNGKILQIREYELNEQYKNAWRLPLCKEAVESYSNPGMTMRQFLDKREMEEFKPQSETIKKDMELAQKFAKKREYLKKKRRKTG